MLQVFDMLAFKNDIGFWKNKQNVEGLSIKVPMLVEHVALHGTRASSIDQIRCLVGCNTKCDSAMPPARLGARADMVVSLYLQTIFINCFCQVALQLQLHGVLRIATTGSLLVASAWHL